MPVHFRGTKVDLDATKLCVLLLLVETRNTVSYARDHIVTTIAILHLDDAENSCRATWGGKTGTI